MFKQFKNTTGKVADVITKQGENFLKTVDEIESEFRYYAYLYACEVMKIYSSGFTTYKKMETEPDGLVAMLSPDEPVFLEENY